MIPSGHKIRCWSDDYNDDNAHDNKRKTLIANMILSSHNTFISSSDSTEYDN